MLQSLFAMITTWECSNVPNVLYLWHTAGDLRFMFVTQDIPMSCDCDTWQAHDLNLWHRAQPGLTSVTQGTVRTCLWYRAQSGFTFVTQATVRTSVCDAGHSQDLRLWIKAQPGLTFVMQGTARTYVCDTGHSQDLRLWCRAQSGLTFVMQGRPMKYAKQHRTSTRISRRLR